jgi:hypothetical protein
MGLIKFLLGLIVAQSLFLFNLMAIFSFLLLGQRLKIGFLSFSINFICVDGFFYLAQWLRHCATYRKVAGSIPDGVIGIFY